MAFFITEIFGREGILKWSAIMAIVLIAGGFLGYYGAQIWRENPEIFQELPATVLKFVKEMSIPEESEEEIVLESPEIQIGEEKKYLEVAEQGEGITHLARKALKEYLSENSQDFEITPEHKIYIEDYIVKKIGGEWLKLGETLEISGNLLDEAITRSESLSPEQLENLVQYSQLVPALNY